MPGTQSTGSFTAVGVGPAALSVMLGEVTWAVSGTFVGTVVIEQAVAGNTSAWVPLPNQGPIKAAATGTFPSDPSGAYRFRCAAYTSGTIVCVLSPPAFTYPDAGSGDAITPTGAITPETAADFAAQQGILLDDFKLATDQDYTRAMARAIAAGVPILLGPKTYVINNYSTAGTPTNFHLRGVPGRSVIQRTSASGSQFFAISAANVTIDGVIFDMNKAVVTANQWGVFLGSGGQKIRITRSRFCNNGGTLGVGLVIQAAAAYDGGSYIIRECEIDNNDNLSGGGLYLATASHGIVTHNSVHDNYGHGIFAQVNGATSTTNYLTDLIVSENKVERNGGGSGVGNGINIGGYPLPFNYAVALPPVTHIKILNNMCVDNRYYGILAEGDFIDVGGNKVFQSDPSVVCFGGICGPGRYATVVDNEVTFSGVNWGIDWGGGIEVTFRGNRVTMNQGNALNTGASQNMQVLGNSLMLSGSAQGISSEGFETAGGAPIPYYTSGTVMQDNTITLSGTTCSGIRIADNSGGMPGTSPVNVKNNKFNLANGAGPDQCVVWAGAPNSLLIDGNLVSGSNIQFVDPQGNGDVLFSLVYFGGLVSGISSTAARRSIVPSLIGTYNGGIPWVIPSSGGTGYTAATVLAANGTGGGSGWTGQPMILGGVIIGVRTLTPGSAYSGTVTVSASDTGGGTGATFTVGTTPGLPKLGKITYLANTNQLLQRSGGLVSINSNGGFQCGVSTQIVLQAPASGTGFAWNLVSYTVPVLAAASLTTAATAVTGAEAIVSDANSPVYGGVVAGGGTTRVNARCDGTNWRFV